MKKVDPVDFQNKVYIYDTMRKTKVKFEPIEKGRIGMYVCGPTVYDDPHVGHARAAIAFDVIFRFFKYIGFDVTYVRNYTDVDDKIINRANEKGISTDELSEKYIKSYEEDMKALNVLEPTYKPRVTQHIPHIIEMIEKILANGHGYVAEENVYFDVLSFPEYGKLSGRNIDELVAGVRVEPGPGKKHPLDFALWKASKPGEPFWESPWGKGRPGWHIECSVMSTYYLGIPFDIHGGGIDLVFPHHENEIAQSEAAYKKKFVNYWIHNGHVEINKEKMSKSLKNFIRVKDAVKEYEAEAIRFFLLETYYRSPVSFNEEGLRITENNLMSLYQTILDLISIKNQLVSGKNLEQFINSLGKNQKRSVETILSFQEKFLSTLADDFHTAKAVGELFQFFSEVNKVIKINDLWKKEGSEVFYNEIFDQINMIKEIFGILEDMPEDFIRRVNLRRLSKKGVSEEYVLELIEKRQKAREEKNWKEADRIREELKEKGILLEDTLSGTRWRVE